MCAFKFSENLSCYHPFSVKQAMQEDGEHPSERASDSSASDILPPPQSDPDVEVTENWVIDADKLHLGKEIGKGAFGTVGSNTSFASVTLALGIQGEVYYNACCYQKAAPLRR